MSRPTKNWAIITGASSGIGREFAYYFARNFSQLRTHLIIIARREELLNKLKQEISSINNHIDVEVAVANLFEIHKLEDLFNNISTQKNITYLINNAGRGQYGDFTQFEREEHLSTLNLNVISLTQLSHLFIKHAKEHKAQAHLINIASIAAYYPLKSFAVYSASKSFVKSLSLGLREGLRKSNINVSCICPGGTYTEFMQHSGQNLSRNAHYSMMSAQNVVKISMKKVSQKKALILPGYLNQLISLMPRFFPENFLVRISSLFYDKNVKIKE